MENKKMFVIFMHIYKTITSLAKEWNYFGLSAINI